MKVSVLIPAYNNQNFIGNALDSVLAQTYSDYEIIVVDDGSTDDTPNILTRYAEAHSEKIKVIHQQNSGPSVARNRAFEASSGDLLAFLDSDDWWTEDKLEKQVSLFTRYPNSSFIYAGYEEIFENTERRVTHLPAKQLQGDIYLKLWLDDHPIWGGTMLVPRSLYQQIGGFDNELKGDENVDLRLKLAQLGPVYFVDQVVTYYRKHDHNITNQLERMDEYHELLIEKHLGKGGSKHKVLWQQVYARFLYKKGMRCFSQQDYQGAKVQFCYAIKLNWLYRAAYIQYFRCLLGVKFNRFLSGLKG